MRIVVAVTIMAAVTAWFAWVAWFMHRAHTYGKHHHHTIPPAVAAHHPLAKRWDGKGEYYEADDEGDLQRWRALADSPPDGVTARPKLPVRHTHRDPTTGRYTPRDKL